MFSIVFIRKKGVFKKRAFFASIILNCTLLFIIEAHIAKTDSVLLTFSLISMILLCGYYKGIFAKKYDFLLFSFLGKCRISLLLKGPILVFMIILSITFLISLKERALWVLNTNPLLGLIILIIMILPWFLSISGAEQSSFFINQG